MSIPEILAEIAILREKILAEEPGSAKVGEMTVALVLLYQAYVKATLDKWDVLNGRIVA